MTTQATDTTETGAAVQPAPFPRVLSIVPTPGVGVTAIARTLAGHGPWLEASPDVPPFPFRAPHHTASIHGLVEELALAAGGVLYLDDAADFRRDGIETLAWCIRNRSFPRATPRAPWRVPFGLPAIIAVDASPLTNVGFVCVPAETQARFRARIDWVLATLRDDAATPRPPGSAPAPYPRTYAMAPAATPRADDDRFDPGAPSPPSASTPAP